MFYSGPERRRSERVRKQFVVHIRKVTGNKPGDWDMVLLKDISKASLSFGYDHSLREGDVVDLKFNIEKGSAAIECRGEVARVAEGDLLDARKVALVFVDILTADSARIEQMIEEARRRQ